MFLTFLCPNFFLAHLNFFPFPLTAPGSLRMCNSHHSLLSESFNICCNSVWYGEMLSPYSMSPRKLSIVCVKCWSSGDHINLLLKVLNRSQSMVYCLYINNFLQIDPPALHHFSNQSLKTQKLLFALNVGHSANGCTYCSTDDLPSAHWTICLVDIYEKPSHMVTH